MFVLLENLGKWGQGGGGDEVPKKLSCEGKFSKKKNHARLVNLKNIHALV